MRSTFKTIESDDKLAEFINKMLGKVNVLYHCTSPNNFSLSEFKETLNIPTDENIDRININSLSFYHFCVIEKNLLNLHRNIIESIECIDEYFDKFQGSWKYFSTQRRIEMIEEFGGDEEDFNNEGGVIYIETEDVLKDYNFLNTLNYYILNKSKDNEMNEYSCKNSIGENTINDYSFLITGLENSGNNFITDFFREKGIDLPVYTFQDNEFKKLSFADEIELNIKTLIRTDEIIEIFKMIINKTHEISDLYSSLKFNDDNTKDLKKLRKILSDLLELKF